MEYRCSKEDVRKKQRAKKKHEESECVMKKNRKRMTALKQMEQCNNTRKPRKEVRRTEGNR